MVACLLSCCRCADAFPRWVVRETERTSEGVFVVVLDGGRVAVGRDLKRAGTLVAVRYGGTPPGLVRGCTYNASFLTNQRGPAAKPKWRTKRRTTF